jgi:hypothetical protein
MGVRVLDDHTLAQDVELECAIEMHPLVCLLWAHLAIHIHDDLLLMTQVHAPLVEDLDPLPILRQGNCILDDNVNLMQHAPNAQHWEFGGLLEANHNATMASSHCVLATSQHGHELSTPNFRRVNQHIQEVSYQVENVFSSVPLEHWDGN